MLGTSSGMPTQKSYTAQPPGSVKPSAPAGRTSIDRDGGLQPPGASNLPRNTLSASAVSYGPRGNSTNPSPAPGSFSSELRSQTIQSRAGTRAESYSQDQLDEDEDTAFERALTSAKDALNREIKIKEGSENLLEALNAKKAKVVKEQRSRVEAEISASNVRIKQHQQRVAELQRTKAAPATPNKGRGDLSLQTGPYRSPGSDSRSDAGSEDDEPTESPTFVLAEMLQALETEGMTPEYYVSRANSLVDLFKRYPTIKYDLVWSIFGDRMQLMLLSGSREVVAAAYRVLRYSISDISSLKRIRNLNTDYMVVVSLAKDRKADVEREQALKFVRAFLDIKGGISEVSRALVRTIGAVAEFMEDRLRPICIETLAEILLRDPALLIASGGLSPLSDALSEGSYKSPESLTATYLFLLDRPHTRMYLRPGNQLEVLFTAFTDVILSHEAIAKQNSKAIASAFKSWSGLMSLSMYDLRAIGSLISSLMLPNPGIRDTIIDMLYSLLRIKPPAWATSYLAGRRLTTYGRVTTLKATASTKSSSWIEEDGAEQNFVDHYTAILLATFIKAGLMPQLLQVAQGADDPTLKRKTTLLIGETLKLASRLLPPSWSNELQLLPELFSVAAQFGDDEARFNATGIVYQISSVSRTLYRSAPSGSNSGYLPSTRTTERLGSVDETSRAGVSITTDDATFRQMLIDSGVLNHSNPSKWNWDVILKIIEGPLLNGKRVEEANKASKFLKRIFSFYRPFKYRFAETKNTRNTQKYVRVGCALLHSLLQSAEGAKYLTDNKLLRQIAECLAQCDPTSGITAQYPMFSPDRLTDTLCGGYFPMIGVLTGYRKGMAMLEKWHIFNMMYHIVDLKQRPDLIKLLLSSFDYSAPGHARVLLSKALTAGTKEMRIHATNALRKYSTLQRLSPTGQVISDSKWAIQLLVTQLYDPEVEVCATSVKILEKACNSKHLLEYIVECRPALDHLGEIGAPLLLRFLSTSIGYHYLDNLDYISNEMDDWFLGRNDAYVGLIEASLARAFMDNADEHNNRLSLYEDELELDADHQIPPHFYRELTRTKEGCRLLEDKGHFEDFSSTIREFKMHSEDPEILTKVKGCLWAVGNVGSMELGAPFLEATDVVEHIVQIAEAHDVMSMRGTAFFVLGLISRSIHGLEILSEHGWESNTTLLGNSLGFCIPKNLSKFFSVEPWKHEGPTTIELPESQTTISRLSDGEPEDETSRKVMELMVEMGDMVKYKKARQELSQMRGKKDAAFRQPALFRRVLAFLETHHYRLPDRHLVIELFDKNVLRRIIYDEDSEEEEEEEEVGGSSGDEQRTERQRSISDPSELGLAGPMPTIQASL
ncbi:rapamycin-insensitive companion of mTOR [Microdochium nivale]|nr:rapamycin-insensitive companion of mTOR [Microdochium nivale]